MKKKYILSAFLLVLNAIHSDIFAQGDNPCTATALTLAPTCSLISGNNTGATNSSVPVVTCDGALSDGDVWYSAIVGANGTIIIRTTPGTLSDIGMAIYTGSNCSTLTLNSCTAGGSPGFPLMPYKSLSGLTPGSEVWIRLWDVDNDETGTFNICATVNCSASVSITGASTGCTANPVQICATAGFTSYAWNGGSTLSCINVNSTGTYIVTVTDADGCTATDSKAITIFISPIVTITGASTKCSNGPEQLCVPAGFSSYAWSNSATTNCITPVSSTTFSVTVTDANSCTASSSHAITVHAAPSITVTGPSFACAGTNPQFCVAAGFSSYSWSSAETVNCINPASTGTYTATVTDGFGCTGSSSKAISIFPLPTPTITGPPSVCEGSSAQLCVAVGYSSYSWSNGAINNCITVDTNGVYTVIVTDANSCTGSTNSTLTLDARPTSTISGPDSSCNNVAVQLCAPAGNSSYLWSNNNSNSCITTATSGTYSVTVTGTNGCTSSSSFALIVFPPFAMSISGPTTACRSANPQLCATAGNYTYQWSNGATTACIFPTVSGTYSVVATNQNGCSRSASKGLTVYASLNASVIGPSSACTGSVIPLCGPNGSSSYVWSTGQTTECINVNGNGNYTVTISDVHGCTASASQTVTFSSSFLVDITGPVSGCIGSPAELCVPAGYTDYAWSTGGTTRCINVTGAGSYSVTVHDPVGCVANDSINISFNTPPTVNINGTSIICKNSLANWCTSGTFPSYLWSNGGTGQCINVSTEGNYSVTVTDANGCTSSSTAPLVVVNITPEIIESNGLLICDTVNPAYSYSWLVNGVPNGCVDDTCSPVFSGTYSVIVTDNTAGCSETATYNYIHVGYTPVENDFSFVIYPNPIYEKEFNIEFNNFSSEKTIVEIYNTVGSLILEDEFIIDADHYIHNVTMPAASAGIYYVCVKSKNRLLVRKIVKG